MKHFCLFLFFVAGVWAQAPTINEFPSREFGHLRLLPLAQATSGAPNLVEGRELNGPLALAFDVSSPEPILYVADTLNNRVLGWRNPAARAGGDQADKVIGQRDMFSTLQHGPTSSLSTGLRLPTSVAVDSRGSLYVLDAYNNRILRYPTPFTQSGDLLPVDLVIGQRSVSSGNQSNQGQARPTERTLSFQQGGSVFNSGMTFDSQGNLWVTDPGNNRVLRFPAFALNSGLLEPAADIVLGQADFVTGTVAPDPPGPPTFLNKAVLVRPSAVAVDQSNRVYVVDDRGRVLFYNGIATGAPAARVLGFPAQPPQGQTTTFPNSYTVGQFNSQGGLLRPPSGVFTQGNNVFVVDQGDHRIMRFAPPELWLPETTAAPSPPAVGVIGQNDFVSGKAQRGQAEAHSSGFSLPGGGAFLNSDLWVVDSGNNRLLQFPQSGPLVFPNAIRVLGQYTFTYSSPNLVEGRELWVALSAGTVGGAVVVDRSSNPPHLYISDTYNNRVLGFRDARRVGTDPRSILEQRADIVIGQPDVFRTTLNFPSADALVLSDTGLNGPTGLAVDSFGNLWVADTGNGRVLRFPSPFTITPGIPQRATVVLGQVNFTSPPVKDAGVSNMNTPYGLALLTNGNLVVSDAVHNRVLVFRRPPGGDFSNYQPAANVLGQPDFITTTAGSTPAQLRSPRHIAADTSDRLYIADTSNNRLSVFTNLSTVPNAAFQLGNLNQPTGVAINQTSGEIWIANAGSGSANVLRYPEFQQLQLNPGVQPAQITASGPIAVALDSFDNLVVVEAINRVTFYYAKGVTQHAASYNLRPLAPGQLGYLYRLGKEFALTEADGTQIIPWATTLGDIQVTVNGILAPIFRVLPTRIDFQVPMSAPQSGPVEFVVQRASTGEIVAAVTQVMAPHNPGFFTVNQQGTGQAIANNEDGTRNTPANAVERGKIITFCLTGQGYIEGAPPDGLPPDRALPTPARPRILSTAFPGGVPDQFIEYSGLGCGFAGGWQLNFRVAEQFPPNQNTIIVVTLNDVQSNIGPTSGIVVTFAVR